MVVREVDDLAVAVVLLGPFLDVLEGPHGGRLVVRVDLDAKEQRQQDISARQLQIGGEECLVCSLTLRTAKFLRAFLVRACSYASGSEVASGKYFRVG